MCNCETALINIKNKLSSAQRSAFLCALLWGLAAHMHILTNGLFLHDAAFNISFLGVGTDSGRWLITVIQSLADKLVGTFELPFLNGFISLLLIAAAAMLVVTCLNTQSRLTGAYIGTVMAVFPVVSSLFAFMFTAPIYCFSLVLSVLAVLCVVRKQSLRGILSGAILLTFSMGIYQAYFAVSAALALLVLFIGFDSYGSFPALMKKALSLLLMLITGLVLYLVTVKLTMPLSADAVGGYQGTNSIGSISIEKLPDIIKKAVTEFFMCTWSGINSTFLEKKLSLLILILTVILAVVTVIARKASLGEKLFAVILFALMPFAMNLIYFMSTDDNYEIHTLMRYSLVFFYILPACLLERLEINDSLVILGKAKTAVCILTALILWTVPVCHTYTDNVAYLKMTFIQQETVQYFSTMVTRIKSAEGYCDGMPVAFIGNKFRKSDADLTVLPMQDNVKIHGYDKTLLTAINEWSWREFIPLHTGFDAELLTDTTQFADMEEVRSMPCYPDDGSVRIVDNTVVVKLTD